jgi:hypothetical protein
MIDFPKTTKGKVMALLIAYIPFFCAVFFAFFDGNLYESPIGGCCIPIEGVVATFYALVTIWILGPLFVLFIAYRLFRKFVR